MSDITKLSKLIDGATRTIALSTNTIVVDNIKLKLGGSNYVTLSGSLSAIRTLSIPDADVNIGHINTLNQLSGVSPGNTNLGAFTGTIIPNNTTIKTAIQYLETYLEANVSSDFVDTTFRIRDDAVPSKKIAFEAGAITPLNTRTILMPDSDVDLGEISELRSDIDQEVLDRVALDTRVTTLENTVNKKEIHELTQASDLIYIDLENIALTDSIIVSVDRLLLHEDEDYSVDLNGGVGGKTRITWLNSMAVGGDEALELLEDTVRVKYQYIVLPPDFTAPSIDSLLVPTFGVYGDGEDLVFTINMTEIVYLTNENDIKLNLNIGGSTRQADYDSIASTSSSLVFKYTITSSDNDLDGISILSLTLGSATIRDFADNDADMTLPVVSTSGILVDTLAPSIVSISASAGAFSVGQEILFTVEFSESVSLVNESDIKLQLDIGGTIREADWLSNTGADVVFSYTVAIDDVDLSVVEVDNIILNTGEITDAGNNAANLSFSYPVVTGASILIDIVQPNILSIVSSSGSFVPTDEIIFTVTFSENIVLTNESDIKLELDIGGTIREASYDSLLGDQIFFTYTVAADDVDTATVEVDNILLYTGTIRDAADNNANLSFLYPVVTTAIIDNP